ncbi:MULTISPECIES: TetR/AcrR family transcriptional regulator [unclassified Microbacterium]|uniref:TetR/AcrR family transcriptional regulator n=1 Tax=unclassified Microbacterium TaxID=2609290 RepID=UPI0012F7489B|nr:TetR family transcriptional regulator [Microbacterium sp. MAH-37]MVQ41660.1 TetR family transcriptional regulator [Microbacterium sp. MAH-37]
MQEPERRRRDPEARRRAIVEATAELITEVGVDAVTHRMIAARAAVPLGATTQYFDTLDDLRAAALQLMASHVEEQMDLLRAAVAERGASPQVLAGIIHAALVDATSAQADRAVVTAAIRDPQLREMARGWSAQLASFLEPAHGPERALAATVFIDGILWYTQINDDPLPQHIIESALSGILVRP